MLYDMWDMLQQGQIDSATFKAVSAKRDASQNSARIHSEVQRLEAKINTLALISQSMWELIREKTDLSEKDLAEKINEVDLRDGRKDGKMTGKPITCPKCTRPTHSKVKVCMYCSTEFEGTHVFQ
jgi:hypothetical protein